MIHELSTPHFSLSCELEIFESDIAYPINTNLHISINSDGFCAVAIMDIDIKEFAQFTFDLKYMYDHLKGNAMIREPFGNQNFIRFEIDRCGHILVSGKVDSCGRNCWMQTLTFENAFDQTYLSEFANALFASYETYFNRISQ